MLDNDFAISAVTVGVSVTLLPRYGTPAGRDRVTQIDIYTPNAGTRGWQVGRPLIVRIQ